MTNHTPEPWAELLDALELADMDYGDLLSYMRKSREAHEMLEIITDRRNRIRSAIAKARGK
jgi:hypothetical protein